MESVNNIECNTSASIESIECTASLVPCTFRQAVGNEKRRNFWCNKLEKESLRKRSLRQIKKWHFFSTAPQVIALSCGNSWPCAGCTIVALLSRYAVKVRWLNISRYSGANLTATLQTNRATLHTFHVQ